MTDRSNDLPGFTPTDSIQWDSSWPELAENNERHRLFGYMEDRFGISERLFDEYLLFRRKKSWSLIRKTPQLAGAVQLKVSMVGIRAFQKIGAFIKPTTRIIQIFGREATRARIEIDEKQLQHLLADNTLPMDLNLEKGYVILSLGKDAILGAGFYARGEVRSQIPRKELQKPLFRVFPPGKENWEAVRE